MAFNPFEPFQPPLIGRFRQRGKRWLVAQTCRAAFDHYADHSKTNILLSHYDDYGLALVHYKAVKEDKYGAILHLDKPAHVAKLQEMLQPDSKYRVFTTLIKSNEVLTERANKKYADNIRRYIMANTNWRIGADKTIRPTVLLIFGELYVLIKYGNQERRVKLADIEKS